MRYLKIYEDFTENSENSESWEKLKKFLSEWGLDVSDDNTIHYEFTKLEEDFSIPDDRKAKIMTDFIRSEVGDYGEDYSEVLDFLEMLFSDEI
jgi:hypothetical protein